MLVNRVEQHQINKNHKLFQLIDDYCFKSKNLYNYANYIVRQEFINNGKWIRYNELDKIAKGYDYSQLPAKSSQQILKLLDKNWKSFFKTIKDYSKHKEKYLGRPKLPKYKKKNGRNVIIFTNQQCKLKNNYIQFPKCFNKYLLATKVQDNLQQVRIIPKCNCYVIEIIYQIEIKDIKQDINNICGIDLGLNNLATLTNNIGALPIVINGKPLKSINQYYNKNKAIIISDLKKRHKKDWSNKLERLNNKRNNKIKDYMHKASKIIIDYCINLNIDTIIVGHNKEWKQKCKMGKKSNQNFIQIPYNMLISMIKYKAENMGIKLIETEESYTSGTSFLDNELPIKENYNKTRRIKRGLFKSNNGILINSDVNGSYQIIKKVVLKAFVDNIEGVGLHPIKVNVK